MKLADFLSHCESDRESSSQIHNCTTRTPVDDDPRSFIGFSDSEGSVREQLMKLGHFLSYRESDR
jgi:hypothetical protein